MQQDVEKDLEPVRHEGRRDPLDQVASDHEEAAHRIGDGPLEHRSGERRPDAAEPTAGGAHRLVGTAAGGPRANCEIRAVVGDEPRHRREDGLVVLQVAIDHSDDRCRGGQGPFDAGPSQSPAIDASQAAEPGVPRTDVPRPTPGAVGGVVVDDDHLPGDVAQHDRQPVEQDREVVAFVERRHDHRHRRRRTRFGLARRAETGGHGVTRVGAVADGSPP